MDTWFIINTAISHKIYSCSFDGMDCIDFKILKKYYIFCFWRNAAYAHSVTVQSLMLMVHVLWCFYAVFLFQQFLFHKKIYMYVFETIWKWGKFLSWIVLLWVYNCISVLYCRWDLSLYHWSERQHIWDTWSLSATGLQFLTLYCIYQIKWLPSKCN